MNNLVKWKEANDRKPLLLKGARQVGKTFILLEFGKKYYDNVVYLHFEGSTETLNKIFEPDLNPKRIIEELSVYSNLYFLRKHLSFLTKYRLANRLLLR